jgi:hypothetical protein
MATFSNNFVAFCGKKVANEYYCSFCDYICSKKYNWEKHLFTSKHLKSTNNNILATENGKKWQKDQTFSCVKCHKEYNDRTGLWRHSKKCNGDINNETNNSEKKELDKDDLILMLIKENTDFKSIILEQQNMMMKVMENGTINNSHNTNTTTNNNTTHTNSHNKAFNLNFFLNETCKNAMNINEFVDSIKLQLSDFMDIGEAGYVQGISNIIVNKLNALDETVRPIHCTDQKRETFYVKDENKWEKEEEDMKKIRKMINKVAFKNEKLMLSYKEKYPDYDDPDSKRSDQYSKFVIEALGGEGDNNKEKENKIIRHISRATIIRNK